MKTKRIALLAGVYFITVVSLSYADSSSVYMQELTWQEIHDRLHSGTKTVIVPTGATEQEGPQMVTGKHNMVVRYAAGEIAKRLGKALVAPTIPFAPSGRITPPEGNMQFAGTISVSPRSYSFLLADVIRSLKQQGFRKICLIGDSSASQGLQATVAQTLSAEWSSTGVQVINVSNYFSGNGQDAWNDSSGIKVTNAGSHAGHNETSEMMAVDEGGVRTNLLAARTEKDYKSTGSMGDTSTASAEYGVRYLSLKIEASVKQIENAANHNQ